MLPICRGHRPANGQPWPAIGTEPGIAGGLAVSLVEGFERVHFQQHAPLLSLLKAGEVRVLTPDGQELFFFVGGGAYTLPRAWLAGGGEARALDKALRGGPSRRTTGRWSEEEDQEDG